MSAELVLGDPEHDQGQGCRGGAEEQRVSELEVEAAEERGDRRGDDHSDRLSPCIRR